MSFSSIDEARDRFRKGEMIILVDDEDRENEGDLCIAAEKSLQRPLTSWQKMVEV